MKRLTDHFQRAIEEVASQIPRITYFKPEITLDAYVNRMIWMAIQKECKLPSLAVVTQRLKPLEVLVAAKTDAKQDIYQQWRFTVRGKKVLVEAI